MEDRLVDPGTICPLSIRWHGRGGYGAKTAAALLAQAVIDAGGYAQSAPEFGPERRGAPVQAFTRISPGPIHQRGPIETPDVLVVLDPRLLRLPPTTSGVGPRTWGLVNSARSLNIAGIPPEQTVALDASGIALRRLGKDLPNIPMLAVLVVRFTPLDGRAFLAWLERRLGEEFREEVVAANLEAASDAMKVVEDARALATGNV